MLRYKSCMVFFASYNYRKDKYFFVVSWLTTVSVLSDRRGRLPVVASVIMSTDTF